MSITSDPDDSCTSYSPSLVKLVTSFMKRNTEETEIRAHKSLAILQAKDLQLQQLQDRICFLEDNANRNTDFIPKLQLPGSANVNEQKNAVTRNGQTPTAENETEPSTLLHLPQDFSETSAEKLQDNDACSIIEDETQIVSTYCDRWQNIVEQLKLYCKQLEADLNQENQLRLKDKQKYCAALAGVTEALYNVQLAMGDVRLQGGTEVQRCDQNLFERKCQFQNKKSKSLTVHTLPYGHKPGHINQNLDDMTLSKYSDKEQVSGKLLEAQARDLNVDPQKCFQVIDNRYKTNNSTMKNLVQINTKHSRLTVASVSDSSIASSMYRQSKQRPYCVLKRRSEHKIKLNALQQKCNYLHSELEKKKTACNKLEAELANMNEKYVVLQNSEEMYKCEIEKKDKIITELQEKLLRTPSSELLKGRLDAAAQVMSKQRKQIKKTEQECLESRRALEDLKKRLSRAEILNSKRENAAESCWKIKSDLEIKLVAEQEKNKNLVCEMSKLKDIQSQFIGVKQQLQESMRKKEENEIKLTEMKSIMEHKLNTLSEVLQKKILASEETQTTLQDKLTRLRAQFVCQMQEASMKIASADKKIQEMFGGIELFLKMLLTSQPPGSTLSSPQAEEVVQEVCSILNLSPTQVQSIVSSATTPDYEKAGWPNTEQRKL